MLSNAVDSEQKQAVDRLLLPVPGVKPGKMFSYSAYKIHSKAFAVWCGGGLAVKLPEARVQALIASGQARPFEPAEGILWREWALITFANAAAATEAEPLLHDALAFTAGD